MNFKKLLNIFLLLTFFIPNIVFAYSDKVILGGDNIGISVDTKEVIVVGFYKVNNKYIAKSSGFIIGDRIVSVNDTFVNSIEDLVKEINKSGSDKVKIRVKRLDEYKDIELNLVKENNVYKTGLYIKDNITGVGTLTYIDPETKIFASLGHEIVDSKTGRIVDIKDGYIFDSNVVGIIKSTSTTTGEKQAKFNTSKVNGTIEKNTIKGIYGKYIKELDDNNLISVGTPDEIKLGPAKIYTVLNGNDVEEYTINIIKINNDTPTKNILFEITDKNLLEKANGVIKGMSGSPIVQNNKIIGAVTHAIVNDNLKGYGIFITTMLEEGEK